MTVREIAKALGRHPATVRRHIREGCPCVELGSVGRGHGSRLDLAAVAGWLQARRLPLLAQHADADVLAVVATAVFDCLKRDDLAGQTLPAELTLLRFYERVYRNVKQEPLQREALPEELRRFSANYLDSVERGKFQRRP